MKTKAKKAQSELVGFILIVALVIVAGLILLVISLKKAPAENQSVQIENLLSSLSKLTTECAVVFEPNYDTIENLIKSCQNNEKCSNLNKTACEYLNESLNEIMPELIKTQSPPASAYELKIFEEGANDNMLKIKQGNCTGNIYGTQKTITSAYSKNINLNLKVC